MINWIITDNNITVNIDQKTFIVSKDDKVANDLIIALKSEQQDFQKIYGLASAAQKIEQFSDGNFIIKEGQIFINDKLVPSALSKKILIFADKGLAYQPLIKFAENLQKNPSKRSVDELFQFLEKNDHPITTDGNFLAFKKVKSNFKDVHTGTFDNSIGKVVSVPRESVDPDSNRTCSYGLHVANYYYARDFYAGGIMLEVEVNPADVVAIPSDYNQAKMRVSSYKVLKTINAEPTGEEQLRVTEEK